MFSKLKAKLKSKQGVSFLFALLAFLIATMVSATIVAAAMTAVKRVNSDRTALQSHMVLGSAAELVRDEMMKTIYERTDEPTGYVNEAGEALYTTTYGGEGAFLEEMRAAVYSVEMDIKYDSEIKSSSFTIEKVGLPVVYVSYVMQTKDEDLYKVVFTFKTAGSNEILYLSLLGTASKSGYVTTITWDNPYINGLGE